MSPGFTAKSPRGHGNSSVRSVGWQLAAFSLSCRVVGLWDLELLRGGSWSKCIIIAEASLTCKEEALKLVLGPPLWPHGFPAPGLSRAGEGLSDSRKTPRG